MRYIVALGIALSLNAAANLFIKAGMTSVAAAGGLLSNGWTGAIRTVVTTQALVFGLLCFLLNAMFYMFALQSHALKISVAYPIMVGGGYGLIAVVAFFHPAFRERLTWSQGLGVLLILTGIALIAAQLEAAEA